MVCRHEFLPSISWQHHYWLTDTSYSKTSYRIDLDNTLVRAYDKDDALDMLLAADQLNFAITPGMAFSGYVEGTIVFRPAYKYDAGTDNYGTNGKMRIFLRGQVRPFPVICPPTIV